MSDMIHSSSISGWWCMGWAGDTFSESVVLSPRDVLDIFSSRRRLSSGESQMVNCDVIVIQPGIWMSLNLSLLILAYNF